MNKKYEVVLSADERAQLQSLIGQGSAPARTLTHARILLKADGGEAGPAWTDATIARSLEVHPATVAEVRQRQATAGLAAALHRKPLERTYRRALDGRQEAHLIALAVAIDRTGRRMIVPVWPGAAPGSEEWTHQEQESRLPPNDLPIVRNVVHPTLTVSLPEPAAAVVICPGGAFHFLAIEHEGTAVADWLVARGVAAVILRYRVFPTPADDDTFQREFRESMADRARLRERTGPVRQLAFADGRQAMRLVRGRAAEWGIRPDRIGLLGFSAGGVVTTAVALEHDAASRPDFAAPIYTTPWVEKAVPADAAPLFLALAGDDEMAVGASQPLYSRWSAAGRPAALHIFAEGGHGFGMRRQGLPSDRWIELFGDWLGDQGLLQPPG